MDPLTISVSIVGLCTAAIQISRLLKRFVDSSSDAPASARHTITEITGIYVCINQLDAFLSGRQESPRSRRSLVMLEQVIIVFTDCVSTFSQLEQTLESLKTDNPMRVIDRVKWAMKEKTISKLLARLQTSKTSLSLILNILTSMTMTAAESNTQDLTHVVQQMLKSNINMSRRLRNIERMHPAMDRSVSPSLRTSIHDLYLSRLSDSFQMSEPAFEKELETSPVYKKTAFNRLRLSQSSSNAASGPSFLSGLSLCDVSNVTAMALPISCTELWNHHRYIGRPDPSPTPALSTLDAWYNPPPKRSAFIRTAYFEGQYTNQYAQSKFTGHLVYRRFEVTSPNHPPRFKEGVEISTVTPPDRARYDQDIESGEPAELEDTSHSETEEHCVGDDIEARAQGFGPPQLDGMITSYCWRLDHNSNWGQGVLRMLESIGY
ncbi:hypothetical protein Q9189_003111 [Teloschistes chrysophthalmus]